MVAIVIPPFSQKKNELTSYTASIPNTLEDYKIAACGRQEVFFLKNADQKGSL